MFILVIKWLGVSILYLIFDEDLCNDKVFLNFDIDSLC